MYLNILDFLFVIYCIIQYNSYLYIINIVLVIGRNLGGFFKEQIGDCFQDFLLCVVSKYNIILNMGFKSYRVCFLWDVLEVIFDIWKLQQIQRNDCMVVFFIVVFVEVNCYKIVYYDIKF